MAVNSRRAVAAPTHTRSDVPYPATVGNGQEVGEDLNAQIAQTLKAQKLTAVITLNHAAVCANFALPHTWQESIRERYASIQLHT
eukprot:COSAG02_NODE_315_length_24910_cov_17.139978_11_plen_85_part_00